HCHEYGYILRYPKGKTNITGYIYEPWHIRYVGRKAAAEIHEKDITLEEYILMVRGDRVKFLEEGGKTTDESNP
ncbi:MAG: D-alanyl-D-alanine carboxypeptidase family protein, partial [Candidatus Ventricola sp.]|nr:D-alanyl-D-alanine carboxypeptidase family protein [Candidatus Ventricola sp.]